MRGGLSRIAGPDIPGRAGNGNVNPAEMSQSCSVSVCASPHPRTGHSRTNAGRPRSKPSWNARHRLSSGVMLSKVARTNLLSNRPRIWGNSAFPHRACSCGRSGLTQIGRTPAWCRGIRRHPSRVEVTLQSGSLESTETGLVPISEAGLLKCDPSLPTSRGPG